MRSHVVLVTAFLVLSLAICGLNVAAEELTNDSRTTAVAVRITFMSRVMITRHGREFPTQDPATGLSDVFVFSGGEVRRNGTFEVKWSPGLAIKSVEWLEVLSAEDQEAMQEVASCSCVLSPSDSLETRLNSAYDGIEICLEPGTYTVASWLALDNVTIRGIHHDKGVVHIVAPPYTTVIASLTEGSLRIENISFGEGIELMPRGNSRATIVDSELWILTAAQLGSVEVEGSVIGIISADDGATVTVRNSELGMDNSQFPMAIYARGDALVIIEDSTIQGKDLGVLVGGNAIVRLLRTEFIDCREDTREGDSGVIEIN